MLTLTADQALTSLQSSPAAPGYPTFESIASRHGLSCGYTNMSGTFFEDAGTFLSSRKSEFWIVKSHFLGHWAVANLSFIGNGVTVTMQTRSKRVMRKINLVISEYEKRTKQIVTLVS